MRRDRRVNGVKLIEKYSYSMTMIYTQLRPYRHGGHVGDGGRLTVPFCFFFFFCFDGASRGFFCFSSSSFVFRFFSFLVEMDDVPGIW